MAFWLPRRTVLTFQNTGKEAAGTYDFIEELEQELSRPIIRLEFRAPPRGEEPKRATFEIVEHRHLARRGQPFEDMLEMLRTYRAKHKGLGPIAPWARQRLCTAYLKIKTQRKYSASLGWGGPRDYIEFIGLRADEPQRVAGMNERNDRLGTWERAPLAEAGITKPDILRSWSRRTFDLRVAEEDGNCDLCFLKDEAHIASAMLRADPLWWIRAEKTYAPMRRHRPSYAQIYAEVPARMRIRGLIQAGLRPEAGAVADELKLDEHRARLIIRQELALAANAVEGFSCECDAAKAEDLDEYEVV